jgi:signal transduction histidine kinase
MLDWGTLNGYSYQPRFENFMLSNKVWDIFSIYKSAIDSKNIKLSIEIENNLSIYSDEKSIDVVLRNIIANAKSYTPEGGNISIRLEKHLTNQIAFIVTNSVSEFKRGKLIHIQNILSGKKKPKTGHHGIGLGIVLIHEYAKNCDIKLELSFENNIVTFKALF